MTLLDEVPAVAGALARSTMETAESRGYALRVLFGAVLVEMAGDDPDRIDAVFAGAMEGPDAGEAMVWAWLADEAIDAGVRAGVRRRAAELWSRVVHRAAWTVVLGHVQVTGRLPDPADAVMTVMLVATGLETHARMVAAAP